MKMLVAVDGSKNSIRALQYALDLAGRLKDGATLHLINAHDDLGLRSARQFVGNQAVNDYLREQSEKELQEAVALLKAAGQPYEIKAVRGQPADAIVETAKAGGYDLVVLGSKGRSAISDILLGSVAKRVVECCTVPVVLVR